MAHSLGTNHSTGLNVHEPFPFVWTKPVVNRVNRSPTSVYTVTHQIQDGRDEQGTSFAMCKMSYRRQQHSKIHLFGLSLCYIFKCALLSRLSLATELL